MGDYRVWKVEPMSGGSREEEARSFLEKIAEHVRPIMENHKWKVGLLAEYWEAGSVGLNWNGGEKINLRLRDGNGYFMPYDEVLDTMLHELCHNDFSDHDENFENLLNQLRRENRQLYSNSYGHSYDDGDGSYGDSYGQSWVDTSDDNNNYQGTGYSNYNNILVKVNGVPQSMNYGNYTISYGRKNGAGRSHGNYWKYPGSSWYSNYGYGVGRHHGSYAKYRGNSGYSNYGYGGSLFCRDGQRRHGRRSGYEHGCVRRKRDNSFIAYLLVFLAFYFMFFK